MSCASNRLNDEPKKPAPAPLKVSKPVTPGNIVRLSNRAEQTSIDKYLIHHYELNSHGGLNTAQTVRKLQQERFELTKSSHIGIIRIEKNRVKTISQSEVELWRKDLGNDKIIAAKVKGNYPTIDRLIEEVRITHPDTKFLIINEVEFWYRHTADPGILRYSIIGSLIKDWNPETPKTNTYAQLTVVDLSSGFPYLTVENAINASDLPEEYNSAAPMNTLYEESIRLCRNKLGLRLKSKLFELELYSGKYARYISETSLQ
jgi:hypothetical protein